MTDFSDAPFVAGSLTGLRAFDVDSLGRLTGPQTHTVFRPGENVAECLKQPFTPFVVGTLAMTLNDPFLRAIYGGTLAAPAPQPIGLVKAFTDEWGRVNHVAGQLSCHCGFYAYFDGSNSYKDASRVAAIIEGYGRATVGRRGFRAQKARLAALVAPKWADRLPWDLVLRNYPEVPVYERKSEALAAHPLTPPAVPEPSAPDFWTRTAP